MKIIKDSYQVLKNSILLLLKKIYNTKEIPEHWKVARIIPIHKKGNKKNIENYRPISNLSTMAKIFERIILLKLQDFEQQTGLSFTGNEQHGFKKKSSTVTAMLQIQAKIS